jgi:hypothetical protein
MPKLGEMAKIILFDLDTGTHRTLTETKAWNFQQGCMLHWLPSDPNQKIIYNDCDGHKPVAKVLDINTGETWSLPKAIYGLGHGKDIGLATNPTKLARNRKVTSYPCFEDIPMKNHMDRHPKNDGVYLMDLHTGESHMIIDIDRIWNADPVTREMDPEELDDPNVSEMWFDHVGLSPDNKRIFILARFKKFGGGLITSMWTVNTDGSDLYKMVDYYTNLSHFEWLLPTEIMVTMKILPNTPHSHVILTDRTPNKRVFAPNALTRDGHPTLSPDGTLLATDCYPTQGFRYVYVAEMQSETVTTVASFANPKEITGELRCDPHCRWSRDGRQLCFDGITPAGDRQVFLIDIEK